MERNFWEGEAQLLLSFRAQLNLTCLTSKNHSFSSQPVDMWTFSQPILTRILFRRQNHTFLSPILAEWDLSYTLSAEQHQFQFRQKSLILDQLYPLSRYSHAAYQGLKMHWRGLKMYFVLGIKTCVCCDNCVTHTLSSVILSMIINISVKQVILITFLPGSKWLKRTRGRAIFIRPTLLSFNLENDSMDSMEMEMCKEMSSHNFYISWACPI